MASPISKEALQAATGRRLEDWLSVLEQEAESSWAEEEVARYLNEAHDVADPWNRLIASGYVRRLGRKPVGQTADAGFQIGVRRTLPLSQEHLWSFLLSPEGLSLWTQEQPDFRLEVGRPFSSREGAFGELRVAKVYRQLRMKWQLPGWKAPSTLQIRLLPAKSRENYAQFPPRAAERRVCQRSDEASLGGSGRHHYGKNRRHYRR